MMQSETVVPGVNELQQHLQVVGQPGMGHARSLKAPATGHLKRTRSQAAPANVAAGDAAALADALTLPDPLLELARIAAAEAARLVQLKPQLPPKAPDFPAIKRSGSAEELPPPAKAARRTAKQSAGGEQGPMKRSSSLDNGRATTARATRGSSGSRGNKAAGGLSHASSGNALSGSSLGAAGDAKPRPAAALLPIQHPQLDLLLPAGAPLELPQLLGTPSGSGDGNGSGPGCMYSSGRSSAAPTVPPSGGAAPTLTGHVLGQSQGLVHMQGQLSLMHDWYMNSKDSYLREAANHLQALRDSSQAPAQGSSRPKQSPAISAVCRALEKAVQIMQNSASTANQLSVVPGAEHMAANPTNLWHQQHQQLQPQVSLQPGLGQTLTAPALDFTALATLSKYGNEYAQGLAHAAAHHGHIQSAPGLGHSAACGLQARVVDPLAQLPVLGGMPLAAAPAIPGLALAAYP